VGGFRVATGAAKLVKGCRFTSVKSKKKISVVVSSGWFIRGSDGIA
jgi:hypothetical protein